jgi:hypothetical protein
VGTAVVVVGAEVVVVGAAVVVVGAEVVVVGAAVVVVVGHGPVGGLVIQIEFQDVVHGLS